MSDKDILDIIDEWKLFKYDENTMPDKCSIEQYYENLRCDDPDVGEIEDEFIPSTLGSIESVEGKHKGNISKHEMLNLITASKQISESGKRRKLRVIREDSSCRSMIEYLHKINLPTNISKTTERIIENLPESVRSAYKRELLVNRCIFDAAKNLGLIFDPSLLSVMIYGKVEKKIRKVYSLQLPGAPSCEIYSPRDMFLLYLKLMTEGEVRLREVPSYVTILPFDGQKAVGKIKYKKSEVGWNWASDIKHDVIKRHEENKDRDKVFFLTLDFTKYLHHVYHFDEMLRKVYTANVVLDSRYPYTISAGIIYSFFEFHTMALDTRRMGEVLYKSEASLSDVLGTVKKLVILDNGKTFVGNNPCSVGVD